MDSCHNFMKTCMDKLMMQNNLFGCSKSTQKVQCKQKIYFKKNNPFLEELFSVNSSYRRSIGTCQMFLKKGILN